MPPNAGKLVRADWDFEGTSKFPVVGKFKSSQDKDSTITLKATHTYSRPGTYFAVLRVTSERNGDRKTPYALIRNLVRVRVVVK